MSRLDSALTRFSAALDQLAAAAAARPDHAEGGADLHAIIAGLRADNARLKADFGQLQRTNLLVVQRLERAISGVQHALAREAAE